MTSSSLSLLSAPYRVGAGMKLVGEDVDQAAEDRDARDRAEQRAEQAPLEPAVEQDEQHRAREHGDDGRGAPEALPLACERERRVVDAPMLQGRVTVAVGHGCSRLPVRTPATNGSVVGT